MNQPKIKLVFSIDKSIDKKLEEIERNVNRKYQENQATNTQNKSDNGISQIGLPLANLATKELNWRDLGFREKVKRIEETVSFQTSVKATYIKKVILDSFLSNEANPEELVNYLKDLKKSNPNVAARLLTEVLKSEHAERLLKLKERALDEKPKTAPIIIVHNQQGQQFNPVEYIPPEDAATKPKLQHIVNAEILDSEAADLAELNKKEF